MQNSKKNPARLKEGYRRRLELSFVISLLFLCILFFSFQRYENRFELPLVKIDGAVFEVIPPTIQPPERPPQPLKPNVFVPDDNATELEEDIPVDIFEFDPAQEIGPAPEEEIDYVFNPWETSQMPRLKHKAIPFYPEIARKAGIEGRVSIVVIISEKGEVIKTTVEKGIPMLNQAALDAAAKCTFYPAMQRDKYVKVKMSIPFDFRLN